MLRAGLRSAAPWAVFVGLSGCVVDFPGRAPATPDHGTDATRPDAATAVVPADASTGSGPARPGDAAPLADTRFEPAAPDAAVDLGGPPDGPDAVDLEDAERPPAPDAPFVAIEFEGGDAPAGCGPLDLVVRYTARNVGTCVLTFGDRDAVALGAGEGTHTWPGVSGEATVVLSCSTVRGDIFTARRTRVPVTGLADTAETDGRNRVADAQRACARAGGDETRVLPGGDGDGAVKDAVPSAERLCACMGYRAAEIAEVEHPCFENEMGRKLAEWKEREALWEVKNAKPMDACIERLVCSDPAVTCDAWPPL